MSTALEVPLFKPGVVSANVAGLAQFTAVTMVADLAVGAPTAGGPIFGVLQNNPNQYEAAEVECKGITKAVLAGTVSPGNLLMVNSSGQFLVCTTGNSAVAMAMAPGVSGDISTVLIQNFGKQ